MPRIAADIDGNETVIVATIHLRPVLIKRTKLTSDYLVVSLPAEKGVVAGAHVQVATRIKVERGTSNAVTARQVARATGGTVLARQGRTYRVVPS